MLTFNFNLKGKVGKGHISYWSQRLFVVFLCCLKFIVWICLFICFCQGAALATMVGWLSYGNKKFEALDSQMRTLIPPLRQAMFDFIPMIDADTNAFSGFMVNLNLYYVRALLQVVSLAVLVCTRPLLCALDGSRVLSKAVMYSRPLLYPFVNLRVLSFTLSSFHQLTYCILLKLMKSNEIRSSMAHMLLCWW